MVLCLGRALAARDTPDMRRAAERAAGRIELPLVVRELARTGEEGQAPFAQSLAVLLDGNVSRQGLRHASSTIVVASLT